MLCERATLPLRRRKFFSRFSIWMGMCSPIDWFLARNANFAKVWSLITFATRNQSSSAVPFQGWSVNILPVRSTAVALPRIWMEDHAFNPATDAEGSGTVEDFFGSGFDPLGGAAFRGRSNSGTRCDSSVFLKAAKS